jgi:hypothetical protein
MRFVPVLCVVVLGSLVGCSSPCPRLIADNASFPSTKECNDPDAGSTTVPLEFGSTTTTESQCQKALSSCTQTEEQLITQYLTCIEAIPACMPGNEDNVQAAPGNCVSEYLSRLSSKCVTAFGGDYSSGADAGFN